MAKVDLRKIKEQAIKAIEKKQYAKAAELYLQIAAAEPSDPDWRQRAGEAFRKVPDGVHAAEQLTLAAEGYAKGGFLLKAIAVCKVVLQIDPRHTATQATLAELYARREGNAPPAGKLPLVAQVDLARTSSGEFQIVPKPAAPGNPPPLPPLSNVPRPAPPPVAARPISAAPPPRPAPPPPRPVTPRELAPLGLDSNPDALVAIDERPPTILPPSAPLEALPLHALLGGQRSGQFAIPDVAPDEPQPSAYEIELGEDDLSLAEAIPIELPIPPAPAPAPAPAARDDMDFSGLLEDDAPPKPAIAPLPITPSPSLQLPRIPLFSSLPADELRQLIERVEVRDYDAGQPILRQGEPGQSLFVIVHGGVDVALTGPPSRTLATLGEGAFFGELGLLTNFPRSATVIAREPTQLLEISRQLVLDIVARSPDVLKTLLRFFRDRLLDRLLGESALFASLPPEEARQLSERFLFLELEPGMRVVVEGERSPGLFVLLCGEVDVVRAGAPLAQIAPGDVFGEISLLERKPATASIVTRTKSWALELPRSDFQEIMLTYPQLLSYVSELAERRKQSLGSEERVEFL